MRGLDYRSVVAERPEPGAAAGAYVLDLGSLELEPISYDTLLDLQQCPGVITEVLDRCFVEKPVMWSGSGAVPAVGSLEQLRDIESALAGIELRCKQSERPCDRLLEQIFGFWLELTRGVEKDLGHRAGSEILADYRRSVFAVVEALLQLLPRKDPCSIETRFRLEEGIARLAEYLHVLPEELGEAGWRITADRSPDDRGFVTWGIP